MKREVTLKVVTIPELKFTERTATALLTFITGALAVNLPSVGSIRLHVQPLPHNNTHLTAHYSGQPARVGTIKTVTASHLPLLLL